MICCVCLQNAAKPLEIFDNNGTQLQIADIINKYFSFEIFPNDAFSEVICDFCWSKINDFHTFYEEIRGIHQNNEHLVALEIELAENAAENYIDEQLIDFVQNKKTFDNDIFEVKLEEDLQDDENNLDESITAVASSEEISNKLLNQINESENIVLNENNAKPHFKKSDKTELPKLEKNSTVKRKNLLRGRTCDKKTEEVIKKYITFGCGLCIFVGQSFLDVQNHFKDKHKAVKPFITCCGRKLEKLSLVKDHAMTHGNPDHFKCNNCVKVFLTNKSLWGHKLTYHMPDEEQKFECDMCPKKFSRGYLLERHKSGHKTAERLACNLCSDGKTFASIRSLEVHIAIFHKKSTNICHVCGKKIRDNRSFHKHVESHFKKNGPRLKCPRPNCDSWLKDKDNLKMHLRYHNDEGKVFTCDNCGKICNSIPALKCHKNYAHRSVPCVCEICHKTFKKALSLKEHMARHTGESLYDCPFCERTFTSISHFCNHKKNSHPVEWENCRENIIMKNETDNKDNI